jgi:hypothetical protein
VQQAFALQTWPPAHADMPQSMVPPQPFETEPHLPLHAAEAVAGVQHVPALHTSPVAHEQLTVLLQLSPSEPHFPASAGLWQV